MTLGGRAARDVRLRDRSRFFGVLVHRFSDWLHLLAHRLINDPDWRMRNG